MNGAEDIKVVFVGSNYAASTKAEREFWFKSVIGVAKELLLHGFIPIVPHCIIRQWEEDEQFGDIDWVMDYSALLLARCDAMVLAHEPIGATKLQKEVEMAVKLCIPVFPFGEFKQKFLKNGAQ